MKMHLEMSSAKWRPFCPGGDELKHDDKILPVDHHVIFLSPTHQYIIQDETVQEDNQLLLC